MVQYMSVIDQLWEEIDKAVSEEDATGERLIDLYNRAMQLGNTVSADQYQFFYAAGYVAYMHPEGKENSQMRGGAKEALLRSLVYRPSYLPAVLYLAYTKMDDRHYSGALEILFSVDPVFEDHDAITIDRFVEARVCCLVECGLKKEALNVLQWLLQRHQKDKMVGIDLINLMGLLDRMKCEESLERELYESIEEVLKLDWDR